MLPNEGQHWLIHNIRYWHKAAVGLVGSNACKGLGVAIRCRSDKRPE